MAKINLLIGTTLGGAEYVAEALIPHIEAAGFEHEFHSPVELGELTLDKDNVLLICTSTHGAGDFPETIQPFFDGLVSDRPSLKGIRYGVIGIGDSSYDTFCEAGKKIDALLQELGAWQIGERLDIDILAHAVPEDPAEEWVPGWLETLKASY